MLVLGISNMRDAAAALTLDGRVIAAAEEERFVRVKHVTALPVHAIRYCLREAGIQLGDVNAIAVSWKYWVVGRRTRLALGAMVRSPTFFRVKSERGIERVSQEWAELATLSGRLRRTVAPGQYRPVYLDHHLCHAASTFLVSPFERAAILVVDGASEAHTAMLAIGEGSTIRVLRRVPLPHSLGQLYAGFTAFLGFQPDQDEYIVMGLAAYGQPRFAPILRDRLLRLEPDGGYTLNTKLFDFHLARKGIFLPAFIELFGQTRADGEDITDRHRDLAASIQLVLEEALIHLSRELKRMTGANRLCLAGGVAYNCVANSRLASTGDFEKLYVQPAAGDSGAALGAALWLAQRRAKQPSREVMRHAYLGPKFTDAECRRALDQGGLIWEALDEDTLCDRVATELARGRLVFWFQGRMEWGPRALGNRSLLADPRREDMRELINAKVKLRQPFRPFAPAVLEEKADQYFDLPWPSPFMQFTFSVLPSAKGIIPAVVHVDGTARVQTVDQESNPRFRKLLCAFEKKTSVPVLLNTSFNVNEPIVCSPENAVACFKRTEVEWLVLGHFLARHPGPFREPASS